MTSSCRDVLKPISHDVAMTKYHGDDARRALTTILPHVNRGGGASRTVSDAVQSITQASDLADIVRNARVKKPGKS